MNYRKELCKKVKVCIEKIIRSVNSIIVQMSQRLKKTGIRFALLEGNQSFPENKLGAKHYFKSLPFNTFSIEENFIIDELEPDINFLCDVCILGIIFCT